MIEEPFELGPDRYLIALHTWILTVVAGWK